MSPVTDPPSRSTNNVRRDVASHVDLWPVRPAGSRWFGGQAGTGGDPLPYEKVGSLLTAAERSFYGALCQGLDSGYQSFAKVRLSDLVEVPRETPRAFWYRNRVPHY